MKCKFSINMYSGMQPPECELNQQQIDHISKLVAKLNIPYRHLAPHPQGLAALSTDNYSVFWFDENCFGNPDFIFQPFEGSWMGVQCQPGGAVHVYRKEENFQGIDFKDTIGLWEYLATIGVPLLARYFRDMEEGKDEYYEKMLGVSSETKV